MQTAELLSPKEGCTYSYHEALEVWRVYFVLQQVLELVTFISLYLPSSYDLFHTFISELTVLHYNFFHNQTVTGS
jgi:hypothetical protein